MQFNTRQQFIKFSPRTHKVWRVVNTIEDRDPARVAIIICDMWDNHPSKAIFDRVGDLAPKLNEYVKGSRKKGIKIIHAPADTMQAYNGTEARKRIVSIDKAPMILIRPVSYPPIPIDCEGETKGMDRPDWGQITGQTKVIEIDHDRDAVSDNIEEIYSYLKANEIQLVVMTGGALNACLLLRMYGIINLLRLGINVVFCRDMVFLGVDPEHTPFVSYEEGMNIMVGYVEKFLCPSISSDNLP